MDEQQKIALQIIDNGHRKLMVKIKEYFKSRWLRGKNRVLVTTITALLELANENAKGGIAQLFEMKNMSKRLGDLEKRLKINRRITDDLVTKVQEQMNIYQEIFEKYEKVLKANR